MSYLSNALKVLAEKYNLRQSDFHKGGKLTVATVSRVFNGIHVNVSSKHLDKFIAIAAKTPEDKARLVTARLWDSYDGMYRDLISIRIKGGGTGKPDRLTPKGTVDPEVRAAFEYLYSLVLENPAVGRAVVQWAKMMGSDERK